MTTTTSSRTMRDDGCPPRVSSRPPSPASSPRERVHLSQSASNSPSTFPTSSIFEHQFFLSDFLEHKRSANPILMFLDTTNSDEGTSPGVNNDTDTPSADACLSLTATDIASPSHTDLPSTPSDVACPVSPSVYSADDHLHIRGWSVDDPPTISPSLKFDDPRPDAYALAQSYHIPVYNMNGDSQPFGHLWDPHRAQRRRQLIVFVRHFYCGACAAYLREIAARISMKEHYRIPVPTSIIVIGCGTPHLIKHYQYFAGCPFPIYADPERGLFRWLGMQTTLNTGRRRPDYMKDTNKVQWLGGQFVTVSKSLKDPDGIRKRDVFQGGNLLQIGGEFLFEQGKVVWCHRMRNMRNHAEVDVVRKVLELNP